MKKTLIDEYERELRDPAVAALLRETFADDPALRDAPGRTERVMRKLLAAGTRPARRSSPWAMAGWAVGALASAAGVLALLVNAPQAPLAHGPVATVPTPPAAEIHTSAPVVASVPSSTPTVVERPLPAWIPPADKSAAMAQHPAAPAAQPQTVAPANPTLAAKPVTVEQPSESPARVADALYNAGKEAHAAGDDETAYQEYQASYEEMPTPNALLASSDVLLNMTDDTPDDNGSNT